MAANRLNVVLVQPEIPQNTGNIARTCVAADAKLWLIRPLGFRMDDRNMKRAGLDYWQHLEIEVADSWERFLVDHWNERLWFFSKSGRKNYSHARFRSGDYLVFGNETNGLPASIIASHPDQTVRIPTSDRVRSLNLSNAVAIGVFEAMRQMSGAESGHFQVAQQTV
jgi:tRNA (cytidine/uridine-2'-O-)-methyltransferase